MTDTEKMNRVRQLILYWHYDADDKEAYGLDGQLPSVSKLMAQIKAALSTTGESHTLAMEEALVALEKAPIIMLNEHSAAFRERYTLWWRAHRITAIASLTKALGR